MGFNPRNCLCFECPLADCRTPCPFGMDTSSGRENIDQYLFSVESKMEKRKEKEYQANYYQKNKERLREYRREQYRKKKLREETEGGIKWDFGRNSPSI